MKIALPIITLILCAGFLISQQVSVVHINKNNEDLETRITEMERSGGAQANSAPAHGKSGSIKRGGAAPSDLPNSVGEIDLQELAEAMMSARSGHGVPNFKAMFRMQSLVLEATPEELESLITRAGALDVPDEVKRNLIGEFVGALAESDPKKASISRSSPHISPSIKQARSNLEVLCDLRGGLSCIEQSNGLGFEFGAESSSGVHVFQWLSVLGNGPGFQHTSKRPSSPAESPTGLAK